ncbi:hypothetical protein [Gemmatirosa kalamazoonensis]|nr:hypothetical protein [Gemmatirosa kalamazoonensis]
MMDLNVPAGLTREELEREIADMAKELGRLGGLREAESDRRVAKGGAPLTPNITEAALQIRLVMWRKALDAVEREEREDAARGAAETEAA